MLLRRSLVHSRAPKSDAEVPSRSSVNASVTRPRCQWHMTAMSIVASGRHLYQIHISECVHIHSWCSLTFLVGTLSRPGGSISENLGHVHTMPNF